MYGILELENVSVPLLQGLGCQSAGTEDIQFKWKCYENEHHLCQAVDEEVHLQICM